MLLPRMPDYLGTPSPDNLPVEVPNQWRAAAYRRPGDEEVFRLSKKSRPGERVFLDIGPGLRISGKLKEFKEESLAVVEVDAEDRPFRDHPQVDRNLVAIVNAAILEIPIRR